MLFRGAGLYHSASKDAEMVAQYGAGTPDDWIEQNGDVITWQDLQTGESRQVVVEQVTFTRQTPPDRGFSGYGGIIDILIRTV